MRAETRGKGGSQSPHWRERHSGQWEPQMQRPWGRSMPGELEQQHTSMWEQLTTALVKWLKRGKWHPWFLQADSTVLLSEARVKITPAPSPAPYRLGEHSHWRVLSKWPVNGSLFPTGERATEGQNNILFISVPPRPTKVTRTFLDIQ